MRIPGFDLYTGATITRVIDGSGAEYISCCAKKHSTGAFGFYIFRNGVDVPYSPFCSSRGSIDSNGTWIAGNGADLFFGPIPGFVPLPAASVAPAAPSVIPPAGAIAQLWHGPYTAAEFDTPGETALRVSKLLAGVNELIALLKEAGVMV